MDLRESLNYSSGETYDRHAANPLEEISRSDDLVSWRLNAFARRSHRAVGRELSVGVVLTRPLYFTAAHKSQSELIRLHCRRP
jgi:hypothetical protein